MEWEPYRGSDYTSIMKKSFTLIGIGALNFLHGSLHIIQFIQGILMGTGSHIHLDSPWMSMLWMGIGVFSLWTGIKDYRHHKKCVK